MEGPQHFKFYDAELEGIRRRWARIRMAIVLIATALIEVEVLWILSRLSSGFRDPLWMLWIPNMIVIAAIGIDNALKERHLCK